MKKTASQLLYDACAEFVRKCHAGTARSVRSYKQMSDAMEARLREQASPVATLELTDAQKHDIADRLSAWVSASMQVHTDQDALRTHIRRWLDRQDTLRKEGA